MPYALSNLLDGERPSWRYIGSESEALPAEVVMSDKDFIPKQQWLWDATTNTLREPTAADRLRFAKKTKKLEFETRAEQNMRDILPPYRLTMLVARDQRADPRLAAATQLDQRLDRAMAAVESQTTAEAVTVMRWEDQK